MSSWWYSSYQNSGAFRFGLEGIQIEEIYFSRKDKYPRNEGLPVMVCPGASKNTKNGARGFGELAIWFIVQNIGKYYSDSWKRILYELVTNR